MSTYSIVVLHCPLHQSRRNDVCGFHRTRVPGKGHIDWQYRYAGPKRRQGACSRIDCRFYLHPDNERNANLSKTVGEVLVKELGVSLDRGYFFFHNAAASDTGYKGTTFANILNKV